MMQFIDLQAQYAHLKTKIDRRIQDVLDHGQYIMGPEVAELEQQLCEYVGVKHSITCANGTDALTLALMALGIAPGDKVFCPTFTFFATAETIALAGAVPVFVDSDSRTFNMCPKDLERRIAAEQTKNDAPIKAIMTVDLFGLPANYPEISAIAEKHGLKLIEDAAQGFGGQINGRKACSFGDVSTTSFFPAKPLGCYGDGGAVFTNCDETAELLKSLRVHGKGTDKYDNVRIGVNSRLDTLQSAILLEKLAAFPDELEVRNAAAERYHAEYAERFVTPWVPEGYYSSWAQYTLQASSQEERDKTMNALKDKGIPTMVYYRTCMHEQTAFAHLGYQLGDLPVAERLSRTVFSLPMHGYMTNHPK